VNLRCGAPILAEFVPHGVVGGGFSSEANH